MTTDNLVFQLHSRDMDILVLQVTAASKLAAATQLFYVSHAEWQTVLSTLNQYIQNPHQEVQMEIGINADTLKIPAFSLGIYAIDTHGRMLIEIDVLIMDAHGAPKNALKEHRCSFFTKGEIGALEQMINGLEGMAKSDAGTIVRLFEDETAVLPALNYDS